MPSPAATFDEIRAVAASLPSGGETGSGMIAHPRIVLYAATHGIAADRPGGSPAAMAEAVAALIGGQGALHELVARADSDLRLYDLALDRPTRDSRGTQAMDEVDACRAAAYGMMAVEPGIDIVVVAAVGIGATLSGVALAQALARQGALHDPLEQLAALGGPDIAAVLGVILATRLAGVPVILDGVAAYAAGAVARRLRPDALAHCRLATGDAAGFTGAALGIEMVLPGPADSPLTGARALIAAMGMTDR